MWLEAGYSPVFEHRRAFTNRNSILGLAQLVPFLDRMAWPRTAKQNKHELNPSQPTGIRRYLVCRLP